MNRLPEHLVTLLTPAAYGHPVGEIRLIETHVSWVLLAGELAYKIKRPVRYPFVDMTSPERRHFLCEEELRLNRRFAPDIYLDVVSITSDGGQARMSGPGPTIEHAVRMRRFERDEELAQLLMRQAVTAAELAGFGRGLAQIHECLPVVEASNPCGSVESVRTSLAGNLQQLEKISARVAAESITEAPGPGLHALLESNTRAIAARRASGRVRECHGDLHSRNVARYAGRLVAFDCLEFEPAFRWIDVAEEIAFLFMDMGRHGAHAHASAFLNGYFAEGGDYGAARLVHLYAAHRALVRAKVAALDALAGSSSAQAALDERTVYVARAREHLEPKRPALVLVSGVSGSGKTWLSERLATATGAIHVRSDLERKRIGGFSGHAASGSAMDQDLYSADMNVRTYARLAECAAEVLAGGFTVIVDATFQRRADRAVFIELAADHRVPVALVRCHAPEAVLRSRISERARSGNDASEADVAVLERQQARYEAVDPAENLPLIDADTTNAAIVTEVAARLAPFGVSS